MAERDSLFDTLPQNKFGAGRGSDTKGAGARNTRPTSSTGVTSGPRARALAVEGDARNPHITPTLLVLCSGAGGATEGYKRVGFYTVDVDIDPQPHHRGDEFVQADIRELDPEWIAEFDGIHASPPCQFYASLSKGEHWRSIPETRAICKASGLPYVIENIQDAAWDMENPARLCGSMFGLRVRRHRLFETSFPLMVPTCHHENHGGRIRAYYGKKGWLVWTPASANVQKKGRTPLLRGSVEDAPGDMGIDWMTWDELREAIPPAYTELVGHQLMQQVRAAAA